MHSLNSIKYSDFLGVGSYNITNDLSYAFHTPISVAEKIAVFIVSSTKQLCNFLKINQCVHDHLAMAVLVIGKYFS